MRLRARLRRRTPASRRNPFTISDSMRAFAYGITNWLHSIPKKTIMNLPSMDEMREGVEVVRSGGRTKSLTGTVEVQKSGRKPLIIRWAISQVETRAGKKKSLPLTIPVRLYVPNYGWRAVQIVLVAPGVNELHRNVGGQADGAKIYLYATKKWDSDYIDGECLDIIIHELTHVFDPKLRQSKLKHLRAAYIDAMNHEANITNMRSKKAAQRATADAYYSTPHEIDAYMTGTIFELTKLLDRIKPQDLEYAKIALIDYAREYAKQLTRGRGKLVAPPHIKMWSKLGPNTWRRFIKGLVKAIQNYSRR